MAPAGPALSRISERNDLQLAIDARMREGIVVAGLEVGVRDVGVRHAERSEDALANVVVPGSAGDGGDDLSGRHVEQVVVGVVAAEAGGGFMKRSL